MMPAELSDFILKTLCQHQGCLDYKQLCLAVRRSNANGATDEILRSVLNDSTRFVMARAKSGKVLGSEPSPDTAVIVAKTALRVCPSLEEDCDSCSDLHLCRYFVNGGCKYKNKCKHTHDLDSYHNTVLLKRDGLLDLDKVELFQLLLQNDTSLLPNICSYYNAGKGVHGSCNFKNECKKLHICKHFFQDSCKFGATCTRSHTFDDRAKEILKGWGLSAENQLILQKIYRNRFIISRSVEKSDETNQTEAVGDSSASVKPINEASKDICLFFLQGKCRFDATCRSVHCPLPYKWEKLDSNGMTWKDVPNEEDVEMAYCNPENDSSTESPPVNFLTMMCESAKVRRLSTPSSVKMLSPFPLATEWIWYRKNDNGRWIELETEVKKSIPSATSEMVEKLYLGNVNGSVPISVGNKTCTLNCRARVCAAVLDMYLRSDEDEAKVALRRRPRRRN
ncbi:protein mono-ADP-ribosyltransferase PARP12-like isoform X2 [Scleropages formosus]|uniref:protein mono-ADP-ribosyltransferase PARP12-like isoform X2 n=1 Tax=Scleropages formosus TaxID=113540 RepID=UPI0010FAAB51|nr:protein mono-ADP-ribosyltransferase PARP12-like isoform X2 [Scleropages formosus]